MTAVKHAHGPRPGQRSTRRLLASAAVLGLALVACAPSEKFSPDPNLGWLPASSPKQLEVDRAEYRHAVYFATDRAEIPALERDRLLAFLASVGPNDGDTVRLEGHADERAADVYNMELAARRASSVAEFLREAGLTDVRVTSSAYGETVPAVPGEGPEAWRRNRRVELVLERHLVTLPPCPDWSRRSGHDYSNQPHSNFGCATTTNLGLMIAEPKDLVRGRTLGPADGVREAEAIVRYRSGKVVELEEEGIGE